MRLVVARKRISRRASLVVGVLVALTCLSAIALAPGVGAAQPPAVYTYPIPGDHVASPQTQIAFRGVRPGQVGSITVTGSVSGAHSGSFEADSDRHGGSFLPAQPFTPGETVTVQTSLNIAGATNGEFSFQVATPAGSFPPQHWPIAAPRFRGDVWQFHSRPDLAPAAVTITKRSNAAPGDIFVAPQEGPIQDGPEILDPNGQLIWFKSLPGDDLATDFRVQSYHGAPVLTWWQGYQAAGIGIGVDVINDSSYRQIAAVRAANGLNADLHEFQLTQKGTALIVAEYPVIYNASSVHGSTQQNVLDSVVQEIDIPTGLVLFQWDSLDHVPLTDTYQSSPGGAHRPFDYFHVNSVDVDHDGNLVISGRNTWAAYKLNHHTGAVIWRLGGRHSSFKLARGVYWAFQHDVRIRSYNDWFVTLFDDDRAPGHQSRGIKLFLDLRRMTAKQVAQHAHSPALYSSFEGNFQQLSDRHDFLGWGQQAYFSEYDSRGNLVFDGHFIDDKLPYPVQSYRAYRFVWNGTPVTLPAIDAVPKGHSTVVYASWNGATNVASWHVLGGSTLGALTQVGSARRSGFETTITVRGQQYVAVQAIGASGNVLQTSSTVKVP